MIEIIALTATAVLVPAIAAFAWISKKRTEYGGRSYHSKAEAATAALLDNLQRVGKIRSWLPQQPSFPMPGGGKYTADFLIFLPGNLCHVHDTKGYDTAEGRLKRSYVEEKYGVYLTISDNELLEEIEGMFQKP